MVVWLIWEHWSNSFLWCMYEQDGHIAMFSSMEKAEEFVRTHPWLIKGEVSYSPHGPIDP